MSLTIEVIRELGDNPAPDDIVVNYFASEQVFKQIGRVEIDKASKGFRLVTITLPGMRTHVRVGQVIKLMDDGIEYRAKVKSIQFDIGRNPDGTPFGSCSMGLRMMEVT